MKDTLRRLTLVRHGETDWNASGIVQGHDDQSRLSSEGQRQASEAAHVLHHRDVEIIVTSDLTRAKETAEILARELELPLLTSALLRERSYGDYEGRPTHDLTPQLTGFHDGRVIDASARPPGGESLDDVARRASIFLERLTTKFAERHVLAVTHGGTIRALRAVATGQSMSDIEWYPVPNCSIWSLEF